MKTIENKAAYTQFAQVQILALLLGLTLFLTGCSVGALGAVGLPQDSVGTVVYDTEATVAEEPSRSDDEISYGGDKTSYDYTQDTFDAQDGGAVISLHGNAAQIDGDGATFTEGTLTIKQSGIYELSGTLNDGQILVDAGKNDVVRLVLNGVSISNSSGPALYAPKSERVVLILEEGTENTITDGDNYPVANDENEPDAAIFVQDDLIIAGSGTLTVIGNNKHGIRVQDILEITGGNINITSAGDALRGRDGVAILDGIFTINAGGDGIQSNNANSADVGFVIINGGIFNIKAQSDGIQAQSSLTITDGKFDITTGGGSANAPVQAENFRGGGGGRGWGNPWGGGTADEGTQTADDESVSMKALKAGTLVYITGGDFTIDAEDDALHSNDRVKIESGMFAIQTGDDGFHADSALEIAGGEIDITYCYEGMEGLSVTISGGDISIVANDDALNAAGGVDSIAQGGGPMGRDRFAANGDIYVRITGGTLDLYAARDGIDSNGNVFIDGGTLKISGPSQGMEGAIDLDGSLTITGGELITAGSVLNISQDSTQPVVLVSYSHQQDSGSVIEIKNQRGDTLLEYTSKTAFSMSGFTSPAFKIGETYSLLIGGERICDVKLDSVIIGISDDGSSYNAGRGFGRGDWGAPSEGGRGGGFPQGDWGQPPQGGDFMPPGGSRPDGTEIPPNRNNRPGG